MGLLSEVLRVAPMSEAASAACHCIVPHITFLSCGLCRWLERCSTFGVITGLDPVIHVLLLFRKKTWMAGSSSAKTRFALFPGHDERGPADLPDGQITERPNKLFVQPILKKYSASPVGQIKTTTLAILSH
jgi:hypothetical protein